MLYDKRWELDKTGKVLDAAADYIGEHGWCQFDICDDFGRVCALGAIARVTTDSMYSVFERLDRYMALLKPRTSGARAPGIVEWNDMVGRTQEEVVALLRGAARA